MTSQTPPPVGRRPTSIWATVGCGLAVATVAAALTAAFAFPPAGHAIAAPPAPPQQSPLWISLDPLAEERRLMVVVDPVSRSAAVYHLDAASGTLTLKSTRDLRWDLMIGEFNAQEPTPATLRKMLDTPAPGK